MRFFTRLSEREIDSVLAGKDPSGDGELQAVAAFFRDARAVLEETSTPAAEIAHLTAIFAAARESAAVSEPSLSRRAPARRGKRFSPVAARVSIAAAVVAALAALGGAASAGLLPAPVQRTVSDLARHVGISLPHSRHHAEHGGSGNQGGNQGGAPKGGNQPEQSRTQTGADETNGDRTNGDQTKDGRDNRDQSSGDSGSGDSGSGDSGSGDSGSGDTRDGGVQGTPPGTSRDGSQTTTADESAHGDAGNQGTPSGDSGTSGDPGNGTGAGDPNG